LIKLARSYLPGPRNLNWQFTKETGIRVSFSLPPEGAGETLDAAGAAFWRVARRFQTSTPVDVIWPGILAGKIYSISKAFVPAQEIATHFPANRNNTVNGKFGPHCHAWSTSACCFIVLTCLDITDTALRRELGKSSKTYGPHGFSRERAKAGQKDFCGFVWEEHRLSL